MTREELIGKGSHKVRNTPDLMHIYISLFQQEFGYAPNCAGCTFGNDWRRFVAGKNPQKTTSTMASAIKTFELKEGKSDILAYRKDKKTYRVYANKATDAFMVEYLTNGTLEELDRRKKMFKTLPAHFESAKPKRKRAIRK